MWGDSVAPIIDIQHAEAWAAERLAAHEPVALVVPRPGQQRGGQVLAVRRPRHAFDEGVALLRVDPAPPSAVDVHHPDALLLRVRGISDAPAVGRESRE